MTIFARVVLTALLFVQFTMATQACMMTEAKPAMAFSVGSIPNCSMPSMQSNSAHHNPNACLIHCTANAQHLDSGHSPDATHTGLNLAIVTSFSQLVIAAHRYGITVRIYPPALIAFASGPPLYLLLQNFRN